jgi:adenylosuccinate synthase
MGKVIVVVGGQFGSEGKGAIAGYLSAQEGDKLMAVRVGGPNAGHTVYVEEDCPECKGRGWVDERTTEDYDSSPFPCSFCTGKGRLDRKYAFRQLPVAAVTNPGADCYIAAGSEVDPIVLEQEIIEVGPSNLNGRFFMDSQVTMLENRHKDQESGMQERLGSTQKGVGAARAERIMRRAKLVEGFTCNVADIAEGHLRRGGTVIIEGVQGYGLGLHAGYYPYCTSIDCRAIDFLAMAGVNPWGYNLEIWVVFRAYPIRVAGDSGPLLGETTWEALGLPEEYTTVTKKLRRVGMWDPVLAKRAIQANGGPRGPILVVLTMFDHWFPELVGREHSSDLAHVAYGSRMVELGLGDCSIPLIGTSPYTLIDRRRT